MQDPSIDPEIADAQDRHGQIDHELLDELFRDMATWVTEPRATQSCADRVRLLRAAFAQARVVATGQKVAPLCDPLQSGRRAFPLFQNRKPRPLEKP